MNANDLIDNLYKAAAEMLLANDAKLAECSAICMMAVDYIDQLSVTRHATNRDQC